MFLKWPILYRHALLKWPILPIKANVIYLMFIDKIKMVNIFKRERKIKMTK